MADIRLGDIVIDKASGDALRVIGIERLDAEGHPDVKVDTDSARQFGVEGGDAVYKCVYLPSGDDKAYAPKKSYAFAEGRIYRWHDEAGDPYDHRIYDRIVQEVLEELFAARMQYDEKANPSIVSMLAEEAGIDDQLVEDALEVAQSQLAESGGDSNGDQ